MLIISPNERQKLLVMKTINIILTVLVLALSTNAYADEKDGKKENNKKAKVEKKMDAELSLEKWMTELKDFANFHNEELDKELTMESWMTTSFEIGFQDEELEMENWMKTSFEFNNEENFDQNLEIEEWMTKVFEIN